MAIKFWYFSKYGKFSIDGALSSMVTEETQSIPEKLKIFGDRKEKATPSTQTVRAKRIALSEKPEVKSNTVVETSVIRKLAKARPKNPLGLVESKDMTFVPSPRRSRRVLVTSQQGTPSSAIATNKLLPVFLKEHKQNNSPSNTADAEETKGKLGVCTWNKYCISFFDV